MHGAGRVCRNIFDVDREAFAHIRPAVIGTQRSNRLDFTPPYVAFQPQVDEAGTCDLGLGNRRITLKMFDDLFRQCARIAFRLLGKNHRRVCREVAMGRVSRRFHGNIAACRVGRQRALQFESIQYRVDPGREGRVKCLHFSHGARLAYRREMAR